MLLFVVKPEFHEAGNVPNMVQIWGSKQLLDSPIDALAVDPYVMCPGSRDDASQGARIEVQLARSSC